ncbi:MAG: site-2 protease family protein [Bacilli bacterium]|nr:site-2 protease family protein [Bacilli bacterium]
MFNNTILVSLNSFWSFIGNLLLFVVALGVLVTIHELGHFSMAKAFNVYCNEFSIGFGPKIFGHKRKGGETTFSIRAIPLGGYVSMYGEGMDVPEGEEKIPEERSLTGVKKWKRAIIMVAGVVLNFILGFILISANCLFFPQNFGTRQLKVFTETDFSSDINSIAGYEGGMGDLLYVEKIELISNIDGESKTEVFTIKNSDEGEYNTLVKALSWVAPQTYSDTLTVSFYLESLDDNGNYVPYKDENNDGVNEPFTFVLNAQDNFVMTSDQSVEVGKTYYVKDYNSKEYVTVLNPQKSELSTYYQKQIGWKKLGITTYIDSHRLSFGPAMKMACKDYGTAASAIVKSIGELFIGKGWENVGGPVAIFKTQEVVINNGGFGMYLYLWGMISINLGIFNLLPFPGLDGWHFLVIIIESITRKEINPKVKNIVSSIGLILLFVLMGVVLIKDIFF